MNDILNLFTAPAGLPEPIPENKDEEYRFMYKKLGPFRKHEYDLDLCVLYRQMNGLRQTYSEFAGAPYTNYVHQIRQNVLGELKHAKLNADFYLDHFYFVIEPGTPSYETYLPLFLSLADYLKVVPILEFQIREYSKTGNSDARREEFLGLLEYKVCNYIRANHFPQDWFAKHEKILNWVYNKRNQVTAEQLMDAKFDYLVEAINKKSKAGIPKEALRRPSVKQKNDIVSVKEDMVEILVADLKVYFSDNSIEPLRSLLRGKARPSEKIIFLGAANQLIDVFRIYSDDGNIVGTKRAIANWLAEHFMTFTDKDDTPQGLGGGVENVMYKEGLPPKDKRILLTGLKNRVGHYYGDKTA